MPLYIDIHEIPGITSEQAAAGHIADIEIPVKGFEDAVRTRIVDWSAASSVR